MKSLKKIIGSLGRRYGGKSFERFRKAIYDTLALPGECRQWLAIRRKRYPEGSMEEEFRRRYYHPGHSPRPPKPGVIALFDGRLEHGGLTDRIRGVLSTWAVARRRGLPFYICWISPFRLEDYLLPAEGGPDWRISANEISDKAAEAFPLIIDQKNEWQAELDNRMRLDMALHNRRVQTHIYSNSDNSRGNYTPLWRELFTLSPRLQKAVDSHLAHLGSNYHAFSFRFIGLLGGFTDNVTEVLPPDRAEELVAKVIAEFRRLAAALPADCRILIASDSRVFLDRVADADPRIYIVEGDVKHIDYAPDAADDVWLKVFVDQQLLMRARSITLMRTGRMYRSGFPRFAAEIGGVAFIDHQF